MTLAMELTYQAPTSLDEVLAALAAGGGRSAPLAGGTDLVPGLRDDRLHLGGLVDLKRVAGLDHLEIVGDELHVGCLVTFTDLLGSSAVIEHAPVLAEMAGMVASVGIRNRATVVGNICTAVPSCDAGPLLLVLDAVVHTVGPGGARTIPIERWFVGPRRTAIRPDEIVTHLTIPLPGPGHGAAYARLSRTRGEDLAQASVTVLVGPGLRPRVAFAAVAPTAVRARRIEALLGDRGLDAGSIEAAVELVPDEIAPITDVRATARYRSRMCQVMLRRALTAAAARADGAGAPYGTALM
jgi:CO/xanthine dehydrogenase FAD-binding subunit